MNHEKAQHELIHYLLHEFKTPLFMFRSITESLLSNNTPTPDILQALLTECDRQLKIADRIEALGKDGLLSVQSIQDIKKEFLPTPSDPNQSH